MLHNPADLTATRQLVQCYEQGKDFAQQIELASSSSNTNYKLEKDIEVLTQQMKQMTINYATIASALTEPNEKPRPKPTTYQCYQPNRIQT